MKTTYVEGEHLEGLLRLPLHVGELIPAESAVQISLKDSQQVYLLNELIDEKPSNGFFI